jgi:hypothetical protein
MPKRNQTTYYHGEDGNVYGYADEFDEEPVARKSTKRSGKTVKKATKVAGKRSLKVVNKTSKKARALAPAPKITKKVTKVGKTAKTAKTVAKVAKKAATTTKRATKAKETEEVELDETQLQELNQKERLRMYKKCKRFCNAFEKEEAKRKYESLEEWKKVDLLITSAASILSRWRGLKGSKKTFAKSKHLPGAVDPLRKKGEDQLKLALEKAANLSPEDAAKLWQVQERNVGVTNFDDLITKKTYTSRKLGLPEPVQQEAEAEVAAELVMESEQPVETAEQTEETPAESVEVEGEQMEVQETEAVEQPVDVAEPTEETN